jgi:hypothetical protein
MMRWAEGVNWEKHLTGNVCFGSQAVRQNISANGWFRPLAAAQLLVATLQSQRGVAAQPKLTPKCELEEIVEKGDTEYEKKCCGRHHFFRGLA